MGFSFIFHPSFSIYFIRMLFLLLLCLPQFRSVKLSYVRCLCLSRLSVCMLLWFLHLFCWTLKMHTYIYITSHTHTHTYTHTPTHTHTHTHTHTNAELSTRLSLVTDPRTNIKHLQLKLATKKERNIKFIQKRITKSPQ